MPDILEAARVIWRAAIEQGLGVNLPIDLSFTIPVVIFFYTDLLKSKLRQAYDEYKTTVNPPASLTVTPTSTLKHDDFLPPPALPWVLGWIVLMALILIIGFMWGPLRLPRAIQNHHHHYSSRRPSYHNLCSYLSSLLGTPAQGFRTKLDHLVTLAEQARSSLLPPGQPVLPLFSDMTIVLITERIKGLLSNEKAMKAMRQQMKVMEQSVYLLQADHGLMTSLRCYYPHIFHGSQEEILQRLGHIQQYFTSICHQDTPRSIPVMSLLDFPSLNVQPKSASTMFQAIPDWVLGFSSATFTKPGMISVPALPAKYIYTIQGTNLDLLQMMNAETSHASKPLALPSSQIIHSSTFASMMPGHISPRKVNTTLSYQLDVQAATKLPCAVTEHKDRLCTFVPGLNGPDRHDATRLANNQALADHLPVPSVNKGKDKAPVEVPLTTAQERKLLRKAHPTFKTSREEQLIGSLRGPAKFEQDAAWFCKLQNWILLEYRRGHCTPELGGGSNWHDRDSASPLDGEIIEPILPFADAPEGGIWHSAKRSPERMTESMKIESPKSSANSSPSMDPISGIDLSDSDFSLHKSDAKDVHRFSAPRSEDSLEKILRDPDLAKKQRLLFDFYAKQHKGSNSNSDYPNRELDHRPGDGSATLPYHPDNDYETQKALFAHYTKQKKDE